MGYLTGPREFILFSSTFQSRVVPAVLKSSVPACGHATLATPVVLKMEGLDVVGSCGRWAEQETGFSSEGPLWLTDSVSNLRVEFWTSHQETGL